jgi:replication factor C large subunit
MRKEPLTVKYCPKTIKEVRGQDAIVSQLRDFVANYKRGQEQKAVLIYGDTGVGKTCMVHAIANDLGLEVLEVNASDLRNDDAINSVVGSASQQMSLFGRGKVILVDEVDGIAGREDRGGLAALQAVIGKSSFPIIITANDPWDTKFSSLRAKVTVIKLHTPNYLSVYGLLKDISKEECMDFDDDTLKGLARRAGGDFRGAINDMESIAGIRAVPSQDRLQLLDDRNRVDTILNALMKIFKTSSIEIAGNAFEEVDEDIERCMLWVEENIPMEYEKPQDIYRAYDALSKASVFMGRIRRWQHWRFTVYANLLSSAGVALAKDEKYHKFVSYRPSSRILKLWRVSQTNKKRKEIAGKIALATHTSATRVIQDTLPYVREMLRNDKENAGALSKELGLDAEEVEWLKK